MILDYPFMTTEKELRELDALIAEHVMGYKRHGDKIDLPIAFDGGIKRCGLDLIQNYSTDPAAAMAVLEKCAEKTESSECLYLGIVGKEWVVGLESMQIEAVAHTLPMAICLFAKKICQEKPSSPRKADNEK